MPCTFAFELDEIQPKSYREAAKDTPFDTGRQIKPFAYRRNAERESFVESKIKKSRLLVE